MDLTNYSGYGPPTRCTADSSLIEVSRAFPTFVRGRDLTVRPHAHSTAGVHPMVLGRPPGNLKTYPRRQLQTENNRPRSQGLLPTVLIYCLRRPRENAVNVGGVLVGLVERKE